MNTGIDCLSLGLKRYEHLLEEAGLRILDTYLDEGKNNYYATEKLSSDGNRGIV